MPILSVRGYTPKLADPVFLAPSAYVIGDVEIGAFSSVWFNSTLRGDVAALRIGRETNIQDGCTMHGSYGKFDVIIGDRVTVGHGVVLHACHVEDSCLIGMNSTLMDGVRVGAGSIVGAGSLLTPGSQFEGGKLILGRPAKVVRDLTPAEAEWIQKSADNYLTYQEWYKERS